MERRAREEEEACHNGGILRLSAQDTEQVHCQMDRVDLCYYRFCRSYRGEPSVWRLNPTVDHFQLRHLTVPTANSEHPISSHFYSGAVFTSLDVVYVVCNSTLYRFDTLTGAAETIHSQPVHTLSSIDVNRGFAVSGGFDSTVIVSRTHDAGEVVGRRKYPRLSGGRYGLGRIFAGAESAYERRE